MSAAGERDDLGALRGVGAGAIAKALRLSLPIGETGEKLAQVFLDAGIKVGVEQAAHLRAALENRLRARLDPKQYDIFLNPHEQLARALAEGLRKTAASKPLIVFLDTYEIVDRADLWLRVVMRAAGPRVVWIVSGRDNLVRSGQFGTGYFKGYGDDFPRRLLSFDMRQLAEQDIRALFADRAPDRALDEAATQAISRATRGVPLALDEAAEMWAKGIALADIVGDIDDATPCRQIVQKMTARYLLHAVAEADKQAIFALALARGDIEILRAMLRPAEPTPFDLDALLHRLERDYASVHYERDRLHDEPAFFLRAYLKDELHRTEDRVKTLNQHAAETLCARLQKLQTDLPRLEDRCEDDDWIKAVLDLTECLFWLDESEAWHWLVPRLVESLAYSRELRRGLLQTASSWDDCLSKGGKKRVKVLRAAEDWFPSPDERADLLDDLMRLESLGWLKGDGGVERGAILDWLRGQLLYAREKYTEALAQYERAERALPENGEALKKQLGEAFEEVGWELGYRTASSGFSPLPVEGAERAYIQAISLGRETADCYRRLGRIQLELGKPGLALQNHLKSIEIESDSALSYSALGDTYRRLGKYDDAIAAYQRAMELDPKDASSHTGLGDAYHDLGRYDEALAAYQRAMELDPKAAYPHSGLGTVYHDLGRYDDALAAYQRAMELDPKAAAPHNNTAEIYVQQRKFDDARRELNERIRLEPENTLNPPVSLGVIARHQGLVESDEHFARALAQWEVAWRARWQTPAGLLQCKAMALLCLGKKDEALQVLKQAIAQMLPRDTIDSDYYTLLQTAPVPPDGLEEMIALSKEAQAKRQGK